MSKLLPWSAVIPLNNFYGIHFASLQVQLAHPNEASFELYFSSLTMILALNNGLFKEYNVVKNTKHTAQWNGQQMWNNERQDSFQ